MRVDRAPAADSSAAAHPTEHQAACSKVNGRVLVCICHSGSLCSAGGLVCTCFHCALLQLVAACSESMLRQAQQYFREDAGVKAR